MAWRLQNVTASIVLNGSSGVAAFLPNALIGVFAVLLIIAGARHRSRKDLFLAVVVFAAVLMFSFVVREYARYVSSGRSLMYGHGG